MLFDLTDTDAIQAIEARDATVTPVRRGDDVVLHLETGNAVRWPGITLAAPDGRWDLSAHQYVALDLRNVGGEPLTVRCRVDNPQADGARNCITGTLMLRPNERGTLRVRLLHPVPAHLRDKLFGMRGFPEGIRLDSPIDPGLVNQLLVFVADPKQAHRFEIAAIRAEGTYITPRIVQVEPEELFPLIDKFGQYVHKDWPGKTHSEVDMQRQREREQTDLADHPGPSAWNQFGGWAAGPQLKASGNFRVEKHQDRWWLVDPEGRLFWSHGIDCVRSSTGYTPISDRKHWFAELPQPGTPAAAFLGRAHWAPHGYYQGRSYETFNFTAANLLRKYKDDWRDQFTALSHRRLRSWGLNTIGNWSDAAIYSAQKTPYVATVGSGRKPIEGSSGYWGKFPDVFDPDFAESLRRNLQRGRAREAQDPWCLGFFVDNELAWGDETSLAVAALQSPAEQAAKRVFVADLQAKYETIARLNAAWATDHASWDALLAGQTPPDRERAYGDLAAFYSKTAEQYFRVCRDAVRQAAPRHLYLGCRFAWVNDRAVHAAAKYCDVVSFNRYRDSVADLTLPEGIDMPMIIGEFHFGALDRGMFHTGLRPTANQQARADAYANYVQGALGHRQIVGTHWFQYGDQATTGRGDGENYQIGFLDICDTPYAEIIAAARRIGYDMYPARFGAASKAP